MICKRLCKTPVSHLLLDAVLMKRVDGGHAAVSAPLCDMCEEEKATKYCSDCAGNKFSCDSCFVLTHKFAKKQGHASIPIQERLASALAHAAGGGASAGTPTPMCKIHADEAPKVFCNTCNKLICAMCGILEHKSHDLTPVEQAVGAHRATIESLLVEVADTRQKAIAATAAVKIIRGELEGNKKAALRIVKEGCDRLQRAVRQRRDELNALVNDAYNEKDDVLNKQITALEAIDIDSEAALQLIEAFLAAATSVELLERSQLFVKGLMDFKEHTVSLKEECASNMTITSGQSFEESADAILALCALDTGVTDVAASTAVGEGLTVAKVGEPAEFVVTAIEVGSGGQRSVGGDDVVVNLTHGVVDEGAAPSGGGGGGGGGAAAKPATGKRKRGGGSSGKGRASKKSKTGASASAAVPDCVYGTARDNGDGTYSCSYTPADGMESKDNAWQLEVLLNGKHIAGSPFAVEVRASGVVTNWVFGSIPTSGDFKLSDGGAVATKTKDTSTGVLADGAGCAPMTAGVHFWELEVVKNDAGQYPGWWFFGVCRPGIDLNDGEDFYDRADTWLMDQDNEPGWGLQCSTCAGTGMTLDPQPKMPDGSRIGLLLDLDNGGTLTMYWDNKPCGTIAVGLVGPLLPCISSYYDGKVVKIHGGLAPPPQ